MPFARFRKTRRLLRDDGGAAAVEFAMVAIPFLFLILASLQIATIFFFDQALQTLTQKSARDLMTGNAQLANLTQSQFQTVVCNDAPSFFNCSNLMVDVESASAYSSISTTPLTLTYNAQGQVTNTWSYSPGNPGDIVILRVMYNWPVFGGPMMLGLVNQPNNNHLLIGTAVFKNEPYG